MASVAIILADKFEDSEFQVPYDRLREAGHDVTVVGMKAGEEVTGKQGEVTFAPETTPDEVTAGDFDALVLPGGFAPDSLRMHEGVVKFVQDFFSSDKPVAAICHAGSVLVEANAVEGRTVTSYASIKTDLINAGAEWVDKEVVVDGSLITSRGPDDLDAFCSAILDAI